MNKRIENMTKDDINKLEDFNLINIKERFEQLFGKSVWKMPMSKSDFIEKYSFLKQLLKDKNIEGSNENELDKLLFKKALVGINPYEFPEINLKKHHIMIIGKYAVNPKIQKDEKIQILIRGDEQDKNEKIEKYIADEIKKQTDNECEFIYKDVDINNCGQAIPLFDTILIPCQKLERINTDKANELSYFDKMELIRAEVNEIYGKYAWVSQIYDTYIIIQINDENYNATGKILKVPYTLDKKEEKVQLKTDEAQEVEMVYKPKKKSDDKEQEKIIDEKTSKQSDSGTTVKKYNFKCLRCGTGEVNTDPKPDKCSVCNEILILDKENSDVPEGNESNKFIEKLLQKNLTINKITLEKKKDKKKTSKFVHGVVYEPDELDAHEDWANVEQIEKAAHFYMKNSRQIRIMHSEEIVEGLHLVESFIAPETFKIKNQTIKKGSWCIAVEVENEDVIKMIESDELTGFSLRGVAQAA